MYIHHHHAICFDDNIIGMRQNACPVFSCLSSPVNIKQINKYYLQISPLLSLKVMDQRPSTCSIEERDSSPYKLNVAAACCRYCYALLEMCWPRGHQCSFATHRLSWTTMYCVHIFIYSIRYYTQYRNFKGSDNISVCLLVPYSQSHHRFVYGSLN